MRLASIIKKFSRENGIQNHENNVERNVQLSGYNQVKMLLE